MAFTFIGSNRADTGGAAAWTNTHGLTISVGRLVLLFVNSNDSGAAPTITGNGSGAAWTNVVSEVPSGQTAYHMLWWKIANASEPSGYEVTQNSSTTGSSHVVVFSSAADAVVDAAANTHIQAGTADDMVMGAANGEVISNNAVSCIFGGKDNRSSDGAYTVVDNSRTIGAGDTNRQGTVDAHRIYVTGETFSGDITAETADGIDGMNSRTFSSHISFVEGGAAAAAELSLMMTGVGN